MWSEVGERYIESPNFIVAVEDKIAEICENLKAAQSHQKSYTDKRRRKLSFKVGDHVYLKLSSIRGTRRFQGAWKVSSVVHWPLSSFVEDRNRGIQDPVARGDVRCAQRLPRLTAKEVPTST
jgi:hypothetical protein